MDSLCDSLQIIGNKVEKAKQINQVSQAVSILAVSKRQPIEAIEKLVACGHDNFGENYVSEMLEKSQALTHLSINWHTAHNG